MISQLIYMLGLASMAGAVKKIGNDMTVAVSALTEQVLLNTTDGAEVLLNTTNEAEAQSEFTLATTSPFNNVTPVEASHRGAMLARKHRNALISELPATSLLNLSQYKPGAFEKNADGLYQLNFGSEEKCTLNKQLGNGSFGSVYACVFLNGSEVAAKFIKPDKAEECKDEFKLQRSVHSHFVVEAKAAFELAGRARLKTLNLRGDEIVDKIPNQSMCIVMEKLDKALRQIIEEGKFKGKLQFTKRIWLQVLEGVAAVHKANIIWRDLKPENILCTSSEPSTMEVKITDFGLAVEGVEDTHQTFKGTPDYVAPEIVKLRRGQQIAYGAAVDVWSLGVLLYELYFGKTPFQARDDATLYANIENSEVHFFHNSEIPEAPFQMKDLIRKCLAKRPSDRPRVHDRDPGDKPLISSHPWLTGDKTHEQERLREWLTLECPLIAAVKKMDVEMVEILFMNGSSMDCKDENGKTPSHLAKSYKVAADKTATAAQQNFVKARSSLENNDFQVALQKVMAKQKKVMVINEILGIFKWNPPANNP